MQVMGLSAPEAVASMARPHPGRPTLSNALFKTLLHNEWEAVLEGDDEMVNPLTGKYKSKAGDETVSILEWALLRDHELLFYVRLFAENEGEFKKAFGEAWTCMMNADRFDGPTGNVCEETHY
jgi:catalase (peroxidase I)